MSRPNKVNKNNYVQKGRLTPDEMARERMSQAQVSGGRKTRAGLVGKGSAPRAKRTKG